MNVYTSHYDIEFQPSQKTSLSAEGMLKASFTVKLTTRALADDEREQVTKRYRERLARLEQEVRESGQMAITSRMLWRCLALANLQVHQELFSLQNVGLLLMANGVQLGKDYVRLHELLQTFMTQVAKFPGLEAYYQLPDTRDDQEPSVVGEHCAQMDESIPLSPPPESVP